MVPIQTFHQTFQYWTWRKTRFTEENEENLEENFAILETSRNFPTLSWLLSNIRCVMCNLAHGFVFCFDAVCSAVVVCGVEEEVEVSEKAI